MSGRGRVFYAGAAFESPRPALTGSMMMLTKRLMRVATAIAISSLGPMFMGTFVQCERNLPNTTRPA